MLLQLSKYRFWLVFATLAVGVLVACSSGDTSGGNGPDGATDAPSSMTQG